MAAIRQRYNKWEARVRVPVALRQSYGGKELLYRTLQAPDRKGAKLEAEAWEVGLRAEWATRSTPSGAPSPALRQLYETFRSLAANQAYVLETEEAEEWDEVAAGIGVELDRMADEIGERPLTEEQRAKLWALQDARAERMRQPVKRRAALEPTFREVAEDHLRLWRIAPGRKVTNTEQQKVATFDLFASFFGARPIREVRRGDAAAFADALRQLDPSWARTGKAKGSAPVPPWPQLVKEYGGREVGLSDATVNRHMATLSALWKWAEEREHCEGRNPFQGHRRKLTNGRNKAGYVAWEPDELRTLFAKPPKRDDLTEVMLVAMFTGMRLNEIASLTFGQIRTADGVAFIDVQDAKTIAGQRKVPLHPRLSWLVARAKGKPAEDRVWPRFTGEGPGKKPGGDAGKQFTAFKAAAGFKDRRRVFHSFRKNVVGQLERAGVPQNEVAQLVGHEKQGLTFGVYGANMPLSRLAEIVALIDYPGLSLPEPAAA